MSSFDDERRILFYSSINWIIGLGFIASALFLIFGFLALFSGAVDLAGSATLFVFALFELLLSIREYLSSIRTAVFYEDGFETLQRKARNQFNYSQIEHVDLIRTVWGKRVRLSLGNENKSLTISTNPRNLSLKTNLYEFLKQKIVT